MPEHTLGIAYALATAVTWSVAVILLRQAGKHHGAFALNVFKNSVGLVGLGLTLAWIGMKTTPTWQDTLALLGSGMIGVGVADTIFLRALAKVGATGIAVIEASYAPTIALWSVFLLGDVLTWQQIAGTVLITSAVFMTGFDRNPKTVHVSASGIALGTLAMVLMGAAIVGVKPILARYDVLTSTTLRLAGGTVPLWCFGLLHARGRTTLRSVVTPSKAWRTLIPSALLSTYVALLLWIAGFKYGEPSTVAVLNQTSTVFTVVLAVVVLREHLSRARAIAVAIGFAGALLVVSG